MAPQAQVDTLRLDDGTTMELSRLPEVDDATWSDVKLYLESNSDIAKELQSFARNPESIRGWLQTQTIADHYNTKLADGDTETQERIRAVQQDPEIVPILESIRNDGLQAALKHCSDEELMLKLSRKMGGIPKEILSALKSIDETPVTLHEACKSGDFRAVQEHLAKQRQIDAQDHKGITPLGYAVGANKPAAVQLQVVQMLLDSNANPHSVDASGNSGLHYAAGYGRKELVDFLLRAGAQVSQTNAQGQTPLTVATMNKQVETIQVLEQHGAVA
jgi:hypothetical protein